MRFKNVFNAEYRAVFSFRIYSFIYRCVSRMLGYILYNRAKLKYGCDIEPTASIGKNFKIAHVVGIVIGDDCTINNNVTLGMKNITADAMLKIGDGVNISTGAKLLGDIYIGHNCIVGANSVVLDSFDDNSVIVGIPAKQSKSS